MHNVISTRSFGLIPQLFRLSDIDKPC